tara:strand:- start:328 stop:771 length:444 start_codon:yes stop_codon:yes gene_type:complete
MPSNVYTAGLRNVGSYQVAGHPWITGSSDLDNNKVQMLEFPYVTKSFTVINTNTSGDLRVHFHSGSTACSAAGVSTDIADTDPVIAKFHFITVPAGNGSVTFDVKCKRAFVSNGSGTNNLKYEVFAELTGINTDNMYHLTGSGHTST